MKRSDLDALTTLIHQGAGAGAKAYATLLRVQADLFVGAPNHSYATIAAFETFALATIPIVDEDTALHVAERLAPCAETPPAVIAALLARGGAVAGRVVAGLNHMAEADMDAVAEGSVDAMAEGLAQRPGLPARIVLSLLSRGSEGVERALAANRRSPLPRSAVDLLLKRAVTDATLAVLLLARDDLGGLDKASLFPLADAANRRAILVAIAAIAHLVPAPPVIDHEALRRCVEQARAREDQRFRQTLAAASGLSESALTRIMEDDSGESLALLLIAVGMNDEDAAAVFLSRQPAISHSVARVFGLVDLVRHVDRAVATSLIAAIGGLESLPRRSGRHMPLADPAERPAIPGLPLRRPERAPATQGHGPQTRGIAS